MKRLTHLTASILFAALLPVANAEPRYGDPIPSPTNTQHGLNGDINAAMNRASFGMGQLSQSYKEFNDGLTSLLPSVLDSESGNILSARLEFSAISSDRFYFDARYDRSWGKTGYDGYLQQPGPIYTPIQTQTDNLIERWTVQIGRALPLGSQGAAIPYVDLGSFGWQRNLGVHTSYAQTETYRHFFLGLGGKLLWSPVSRLTFEVGAAYGTNMSSSMTTEGIKYPLGNKPYLNAEAEVTYRFASHWLVMLSAEHQRWEYGASDWIAGALEPHSRSEQSQLLLSVGRAL